MRCLYPSPLGINDPAPLQGAREPPRGRTAFPEPKQDRSLLYRTDVG